MPLWEEFPTNSLEPSKWPRFFDDCRFEVSELTLTPAQRRMLKARAHALRPVVLLGVAGLTDSVLREIDRALAAHELVKIRVPDDDRETRAQIFTKAAETLSAAKVQSIGKIIVLFRPQPESADKQEDGALLDQQRDAHQHRLKNRRF